MFTGRIGRKEYFISTGILVLAFLLIIFGSDFFGLWATGRLYGPGAGIGVFNFLIVGGFAFIILIPGTILLAIPALGLLTRRFHDLGFPPSYPRYYGLAVFLILWLQGLLFHPISFYFQDASGGIDFLISDMLGLVLTVVAYVSLAVVVLGIPVMTLWPGKSTANNYGPPIQYRSWWAALIGNKQP